MARVKYSCDLPDSATIFSGVIAELSFVVHQLHGTTQPLRNIIHHPLFFTVMAEAIHDVERHGFNKFIKFIVAEIQRGDNRFNPVINSFLTRYTCDATKQNGTSGR